MKKRKQYTGEEKIAILRKHLLEGVSVADVCDEYGIQPTVFYRWQKQLFEEDRWCSVVEEMQKRKKLERRVEQLEKKLGKKDEVLGELMEEYVALKKNCSFAK